MGLALKMVDVPRVALPEQVTTVLAEQELKNPNDLPADEYNKYAAALIGAQWITALLGTQIFDISGLLFDGAFASLGGGAAAYAALGNTEAKEYANKFGEAILSAVDSAAEKIP